MSRTMVDLSDKFQSERTSYTANLHNIPIALGSVYTYYSKILSVVGQYNKDRILLTQNIGELSDKHQELAKKFSYITEANTGSHVTKNAAYEGRKPETIIIPKETYNFGGTHHDLYVFVEAYFRISAKMAEAIFSKLEELADCEDLLSFEKSAFKKCVLVSNGISGVSGINSREKPWSNFSDQDFDDDVYAASINVMRKYYKECGFDERKVVSGRSKGFFDNMQASMPVVTSCGYPLRIRGQDLEVNAVGAYLNAYFGSTLLMSNDWAKVYSAIERDFYNLVTPNHPATTHVYGPRTSAYSKPWAISTMDEGTCTAALWGFGILPRKRFITVGDKLWGTAVKEMASTLLQAFQRHESYMTDSAKLRVRFSNAMREGFTMTTGDKASADSTYRPFWVKKWIRLFFGSIPGADKMLALLTMNGDAPVLGPSRSSDHEGFLFNCGPERLSSGVPHTTLSNCIISDLITRQFTKNVFGSPEYEKLQSVFRVNNWGDDGQFAIHEQKAGLTRDEFVRRYEEVCSYYGLEAESDPGCLFLSTYYNKRIKTNIICTLFKNLFQPERIKDDPLIVTVAVAAHYELLKEHPCFSIWKQAVNEMIKVVRESFMFNTVEECVNFAFSDDCIKQLVIYGESSGEKSKKLRALIEGLTQGLSSSHSNSPFITALYSLHTKQEQLKLPPSILTDMPPEVLFKNYLAMLGGSETDASYVKRSGKVLAKFIQLVINDDLVSED